MQQSNMITKQGFLELQNELNELKTVQRPAISQKIKEAREQGDLSENAEYEAAKEEQKNVEFRIEQIENILKNAVISEQIGKKGRVDFGSTVCIKDLTDNTEYKYTIVGASEADILKNKISVNSLLGAALMGCKAKDKISYTLPSGATEAYQILKIA